MILGGFYSTTCYHEERDRQTDRRRRVLVMASAIKSHQRDIETKRKEFYQDCLEIICSCFENSLQGELRPHDQTKLNDYQQHVVDLVNDRILENPCFFHSTCVELNATTTTLHSKLFQVWEGIFYNGVINWGRITMFLAFNQYYTSYLLSQGFPQSITQSISQWAASFMCSVLKEWIICNGGWVSMLFYDLYNITVVYRNPFLI